MSQREPKYAQVGYEFFSVIWRFFVDTFAVSNNRM